MQLSIRLFVGVLLELQPQSVNSQAAVIVSVILFIIVTVITVAAALATWILW